jgi:hypothetical protein
MTQPPPALWRRTFDATERTVGQRLEELLEHPNATSLIVGVFRLQVGALRLLERETRAFWHFYNLPARTDISRLDRQIAALRVEVRALSARLDEKR